MCVYFCFENAAKKHNLLSHGLTSFKDVMEYTADLAGYLIMYQVCSEFRNCAPFHWQTGIWIELATPCKMFNLIDGKKKNINLISKKVNAVTHHSHLLLQSINNYI